MRIGKQYTYMTLRNRLFKSGRKKDIASFDEIILFFKKHRSPTAMCLIARAANNLGNFQAVVKKRLSKFELFKCFCKIFQQRSQTNSVSNRELFKCCSELRLQRSLQYSFARKGMPFFLTTRLGHWYSQSLQPVYCGSQAVEHSYTILLSPIQTLAANN